MENHPHERTGLSKVKEYVPGTAEYEEKFGYGPPERAMAKIPGTKEHSETAGGDPRVIDSMPKAEDSVAARIPGTQMHEKETGDTRTFTQAIKEHIPGTAEWNAASKDNGM